MDTIKEKIINEQEFIIDKKITQNKYTESNWGTFDILSVPLLIYNLPLLFIYDIFFIFPNHYIGFKDDHIGHSTRDSIYRDIVELFDNFIKNEYIYHGDTDIEEKIVRFNVISKVEANKKLIDLHELFDKLRTIDFREPSLRTRAINLANMSVTSTGLYIILLFIYKIFS